MWFQNGPISAQTANSVTANVRARAFSLSIFFQHALGDAISPTIIGLIVDLSQSYSLAVLLASLFLFLAAVVWMVGWTFIKPPASNVNADAPDEYGQLQPVSSFSSSQTGDFEG